MYWPSPPAPIAAAMVADPTPTTAATRTPADDGGQRQRQLDQPQQLARRHPHRHAGFAHRSIDAGDADDRGAHDRQQRVEHEHHQRGARADAADERHREQEPEHRQARDRLDGVGHAHERRGEPRPPGREDAERHTQRDRDGSRDGHEQHVLADQHRQLLPVRQPELEERRHGAAPSRSRGATVTASINCRTRASSAWRMASAGPDQISRP